MIEMWTSFFVSSSPCAEALKRGDGNGAFIAMHAGLDRVWRALARVCKTRGFCLRERWRCNEDHGGGFRLYRTVRIIGAFASLGFDCLPVIHWRKQTDGPNKFVGVGHASRRGVHDYGTDYILVFRRGPKRELSSDAENSSKWSAFFWEERNRWFSDVWDFKGTAQGLDHRMSGYAAQPILLG